MRPAPRTRQNVGEGPDVATDIDNYVVRLEVRLQTVLGRQADFDEDALSARVQAEDI
jgi:hypothetical protein